MAKMVRGLYNTMIKETKSVGTCHYHRCELTETQMESKKCLQRGCDRLEKHEDRPYWKRKAMIKAKKKANKEITKLLV